jgi:hypothetical protein
VIDLSTTAGVLRFCELRRAEMVRCFERLGRFEMNEFSFGAYVFAERDYGDMKGRLVDLAPWRN